MYLSNQKLFVQFVALLVATGLSVALSVRDVVDEPHDSPVAIGIQASTPDHAILSKIQHEDVASKKEVDKARDCTVKALRIVLSKNGQTISNECQEFLKAMMKNAGKQREESKTADLRKELKELTDKERMNDEIEESPEDFAEKRFANPEEKPGIKDAHAGDAGTSDRSDKDAKNLSAGEDEGNSDANEDHGRANKVPPEIRKLNSDVLKKVEYDISNLGKDLAQLQFQSNS